MTLSKKSFAVRLMAVASALCCATAGAQDAKSGSSVTLFGILDTGVTMTNGLKENVAKKQLASPRNMTIKLRSTDLRPRIAAKCSP